MPTPGGGHDTSENNRRTGLMMAGDIQFVRIRPAQLCNGDLLDQFLLVGIHCTPSFNWHDPAPDNLGILAQLNE
jgi:hypothetical protein